MKQVLYTVLAVALCLCLCAVVCLSLFLIIRTENTAGVTVDRGQSAIYSRQDINAAVRVVKAKFRTFSGCRLQSLTYAGDEESLQNLAYCNRIKENAGFTQCMVFRSSFRSPRRGGGAWETDAEYTWDWYLARKPQGGWTLVSYGYC